MWPRISPLLFLALATAVPAQKPPAAATIEVPLRFDGVEGKLSLRDLTPEAAAPLAAAVAAELTELAPLLSSTAAAPGGLAELNRAAGKGETAIDPRLAELLERALRFCAWSGGAYGPLGGPLDRLWSFRYPASEELAPPDFEQALAAARCDNLRLDTGHGQAELKAGSEIHLGGYAAAFAVDRAVAALQAGGAGNLMVELGSVQRGIGDGPDGRGWRVSPPPIEGEGEPLPDLWLRDQSVALASRVTPGLVPQALLLDHRRGRPAEGILAVIAASQLAVDAQGLAATLFVTGSREGQLRLGALQPRPAALWLLGAQGSDVPLVVEYNFSQLRRAAAPRGRRGAGP